MNISVYESFAAIPPGAREALSLRSRCPFFTSIEWFETVYRTSMSAALVPRVYLCSGDDGRALCALVCAHSNSSRTLVSLTNYYALEYSLSAPGVAPEAAVRAIARHIAGERPRWDRVQLYQARKDDAAVAQFSDELTRSGFACRRFFQFENWFARLQDEDFAQYFAGRPSHVKNTIQRKHKKLLKQHRVDIEVARGQTPELARMVADFVRVYEASWKRPEPFPDFIPGLVELCAEQGLLRLGLLYVDGAPAAAQLWITGAGKAVIYKLAYDDRFVDLGVGSVLSREMFRIAIDDDKVAEIDYGVGSEAYKRDWMSSVRELSGLDAYNARTLKGMTIRLSRGGVDSLKRLQGLFGGASSARAPQR